MFAKNSSKLTRTCVKISFYSPLITSPHPDQIRLFYKSTHREGKAKGKILF